MPSFSAVTLWYRQKHVAQSVVSKNIIKSVINKLLLIISLSPFSLFSLLSGFLGGAVVVDPDSAALSELVASWEEVNHLYIVENFLRHLLSNNEALKCELTATLTNTGSFSVVLSAANPKDHTICRNAGRNLVQTINHKSDSTQDAMLHPMAMKAALINPFNPDSLIKGYLIRSQQTMMTKASDLKNKAASSANEALVDLDEEVQNKKYEQSVEGGVNKASGGSSLLTLWTFVCAVLCMVLL